MATLRDLWVFKYVHSSSREVQFAQGGPCSSHWGERQSHKLTSMASENVEKQMSRPGPNANTNFAYLDAPLLTLVTAIARLGMGPPRTHDGLCRTEYPTIQTDPAGRIECNKTCPNTVVARGRSSWRRFGATRGRSRGFGGKFSDVTLCRVQMPYGVQ